MKVVLIVGPSGSGKTDLRKNLLRLTDYKKVISTTTRQPREGEVEGVDYHFISREYFEHKRLAGEFLETAPFDGNMYGIQKKHLFDKCLAIVEPIGARKIQLAVEEVTTVWLSCPEDVRELRLRSRGDDREKVFERLWQDRETFAKPLKGSIIINSDVSKACLARKVLLIL